LIKRHSGFFALLALPVVFLFGQGRVGEWQHYTSIISPTAIAYREGLIYAATSGGVLLLDPQTGEFSHWGLAEGLTDPTLNTLTISGDRLWLGGGEPYGLLQVVDLATGDIARVDLGVNQITHLAVTANRGFAAFRQGQETGIIELRRDGQRFVFTDSYRNFPVGITVINDLDLFGDSLYVTIPLGVLSADYQRDNLKDPLSWHFISPGGLSTVYQYHIDDLGRYILLDDTLLYHNGQTWEPRWTYNAATPRHITRGSSGNFTTSQSNYLLFLRDDGYISASRRAVAHIMAYVDTPDLGGGYAALRNHGLGHYDPSAKQWMIMVPNSMGSGGYTTVLKLENGSWVAAGLGGLAHFNGNTWYNIIPSFYLGLAQGDDRIYPGQSDQDSPFFLADTIYFRGKQSWNMVQLPAGDVMVGFKGNSPAGAGILRLALDDVAGYTVYDTSHGILNGLSDDGFITIRHMAQDRHGNVWIANPFGQLSDNSLAVYQPREDQWTHFSISQSGGRLNLAPTEIAIDSLDRIWVASEANSHWGSSGGIAVLDYGGALDDPSDDKWFRLSARLEDDHSNTVWSLAFDDKGILWTLSPNGVMGFSVGPGPTLQPYTNYGSYLSDIPFGEGSKVRVDARNNKWISSTKDGLWVLLDNTTFWPSVAGFNRDNSPLPTNEILDIYLDNVAGIAAVATSQGISMLRMPFREQAEDYGRMKVFPSPFRIPSDVPLTIDGLRFGSQVKIYTVSGRLVRELSTQGSGRDLLGYQAHWDGRNAEGGYVGSGVYLIAAYLESGKSGVGKVAVIRR